MVQPSVLVIGANGRMGVQLIRSMFKQKQSTLEVHAFLRDPEKLSFDMRSRCASVVVGDATRREDVERAVDETGAETVVVAIGAGDSTAKTDVRHKTASVLMDVVGLGTGREGVRVAVISSVGAGGSQIKVGFGVGVLVRLQLRHVLDDHNKQEAEFKRRMGGQAARRLLIVRPTSLTDDKRGGVDKLVQFGNDEKVPSMHVDRADVAQFILERLCGALNGHPFGAEVNLTSA